MINNMTPFEVATIINTTTQYSASTVKVDVESIDSDTGKIKKIFNWKAKDRILDTFNISTPSVDDNALYIKVSQDNPIMVIDIDKYPIGDYIQTIKPLLSPNTWIDYTASGGAHIYVKWDYFIDIFEKKVNTRFDGARVDVLTKFPCLCGSTNLDGHKYTWDPDCNPLKVKNLDPLPPTIHHKLMKALIERQLATDEGYVIREPSPIPKIANGYEFNPERRDDCHYINTCVICLDRTKIDYVPNCGHRSYCKTCKEVITRCVLCETHIHQWIRIFE